MASLKLKVYDFAGKAVGEQELDSKFFGVEIKPDLVHSVAVAQLANSRQVLAHTKGRGEVRGGGKKPWKQKGTGRARHGSIRSPLWVGGGITFGPTKERNFGKRINKKVKTKALQMVLSDKVATGRFVILESYNLPEAKTKKLKAALDLLPSKDHSVAIVTKDATSNVVRAARNLQKVDTINFGSLNVVDLLKTDYLVVSKDLIEKIQEHYS